MTDKPKILVAEDDRFLSSLLKGRLEKENFSVRQVFDGEETISMIRSFKPDLIVLDLIMPRVSGFEVLETISIDPEFSKVPVIVLTNLGQDSDMEKAKRFGAKEYFVKARTSIDSLIVSIKSMLVPVAA